MFAWCSTGGEEADQLTIFSPQQEQDRLPLPPITDITVLLLTFFYTTKRNKELKMGVTCLKASPSLLPAC